MPYFLNSARLARYRELFFERAFEVEALPGYNPEEASNPFLSFKALPLQSRYQFLLDDAEFFVAGFIKGPVCRGQTALNVIEDRFWVLFLDPDFEPTLRSPEFLSAQAKNLRLPAEVEDTGLIMSSWSRFSAAEKRYTKARTEFLKTELESGLGATVESLWNGDGRNRNAALTVFRHFDSATVVQGLVGRTPKNAWVIGYPLFERLHYLLVSGFDIFGNVGHQILTRLYMDFLRIEGENNFLLFLPKNVRQAEHAHWYRGLADEGERYLYSDDGPETALTYRTNNPKEEFFEIVRKKFRKTLNSSFELPRQHPFQVLTKVRGIPASFLPEMSFVRVRSRSGGSSFFTLLLDRAHKNVAMIFRETERLLPEEDALVLVPGFLGAYPNMFFVVDEGREREFASRIAALSSPEDYSRLLDDFGVRRTDSRFWKESDHFHDGFAAQGNTRIFDLARYENR